MPPAMMGPDAQQRIAVEAADIQTYPNNAWTRSTNSDDSDLTHPHDASPSGCPETPLPPSILKLPKEILSQINASFAGTPLSASLSNPPILPTPLLGSKIRWEGSWYDGWEPKWGSIQPDEDKVRMVAKPFLRFCGIDPSNFSVLPFHQGMWNKLYLIKSTDKSTHVTTERIFRISLPVNPWFKIQSEVATMEYIRLKTSIPVPKVYIFESSMENDLGFEWMIMEKIDGQTFAVAENSMSQVAKERLNTTIADWVHELAMLQFDVIGSLYREWDPTKDNYLEFRLGPVTTDYFLGPWRTERPVFKGPFRNEAELYRAVVMLNLQDILDPKQLDRAKRAWANEDGYEYVSSDQAMGIEDDCDSDSSGKTPTFESYSTVYSDEQSFQPCGVQQACFTLFDVLPLVERRLEKSPRKYILHHFDISKQNVLLNDDRDAIALLDWENIATKSLSQIDPWPSIIDSTRYDLPEPWQESTPKPSWRLKAEKNYTTRLTADIFMSRLKKLQSPWPQIDTTGAEENCVDMFEEDLAELGAVAERLYASWGETEICDRIREKCGDAFLPLAVQAPRVTVREDHQTSPRHYSSFRHIISNRLKFIIHRKGDVRKQ
ncbi:hypothetical protein BU24DRAFT_415763 [Aaosphaeria arxii CBS 175.79]|uniref:Altered inheritance of mitochondria protein 9, mitochondrial n=1 Tax=Aaosphaeria arxii CBS 175.79 TaxID=1450172 RepID=A0A6A5X6Z8_9PLEO|nr:uncharacterized protein BU24DRAFT_415763 [Aaosphaeria arxii CBS 175.79]KAF2008709.1 hypothetical protein BU24DRAFT_415763 [Aaosphaeria arxii CBS 175.79]